MLVKAQTKKGTEITVVDSNSKVSFTDQGLVLTSESGVVSTIPTRELIEISFKDIQNCEVSYTLEGYDTETWTSYLKDVISIKVKNKVIRKILTWLFKQPTTQLK